jgi:hypothetical protein
VIGPFTAPMRVFQATTAFSSPPVEQLSPRGLLRPAGGGAPGLENRNPANADRLTWGGRLEVEAPTQPPRQTPITTAEARPLQWTRHKS